jgi:hypothetical protein
VLAEHWNEGDEKPSNAVFGRPELSLRADGSTFEQLSKKSLKKTMLDLQIETGKTFVGALSIQASSISKHKEELEMFLIHDPHPWIDHDGEAHPQASNHVQLLCNKRDTNKRELLLELSSWSLHPDELNTVDLEEAKTLHDEPSVTRISRSKMLIAILALCVLIAAIAFFQSQHPH